MTGKGCVYTEAIDAEIAKRRLACSHAGFMVMPFRPNLNVFHGLTLQRFLKANYASADEPLAIIRADQVTRTGYVICNKICKKIQDSDFVLVDVSAPNPNVFYEMGLAYGLRQKIVVIHHAGSEFGRRTAAYVGAKAYSYQDLNPINGTDLMLSQMTWQRADVSIAPSDAPNILVVELFDRRQADAGDALDAAVVDGDIPLTFVTHVKAAIGVSITDILGALERDQSSLITIYRKQIVGLATAEEIHGNVKKSFDELTKSIARAFCTVIRTGSKSCDPMAYFWLGYCHAIGKNVIPVTVVNEANENVEDLAFDIRALWHMRFITKHPQIFFTEIKDTIEQMIVSDFGEWSRKALWNEITGKRGEVSIFTGALHNDALEREMTGDWDLRAVSELTSYLASHQYRARIESPVYQPRFQDGDAAGRRDYVDALKRLLTDKNCVLVASPDVNPLTEIALGALYGVPEDKWFDETYDLRRHSSAVVAMKKRPKRLPALGPTGGSGRTFYREAETTEDAHKRGFMTSIVPGIEEEEFYTQKFYTQSVPGSDFTTYAHLVVAPNPFRKQDGAGRPVGEKKFLIILNGIGGPATFALTHVLTGAVDEKWSAYPPDFLCPSESEKALRTITNDLARLSETDGGIQYILEVTIGKSEVEAAGETGSRSTPTTGETLYTFDTRRVKGWRILDAANASFKTLHFRA